MSRRQSKRKTVVESDDEEVAASRSPIKRGRVASPPPSVSDEEGANGRRSSRHKGKQRAVKPEPESESESEDGDEVERAEADGNIEEDGSDGEVIDERNAFRPNLRRGDDGYVVGSITRIKLINFMTYDFVEFRPGPCLNMILGPNGTGKSSIAAAIAIGLGFSPKIMGRAPDIKAYVKQGTENAEIELELKAPPGKRNYTVVRRFQKGNDKSTFLLNGENTPKAKIQDLVANLGVQANNLCSFLPQDKVAEFAKMNPVEVLKETMRSAGDRRMLKWHEKLVELGSQEKDAESDLNTARHTCDTLQRQVDDLEPEVRNFERRRDLEQELLAQKMMLVLTRVSEAKDQRNQFQQEVKAKKDGLRDITAKRDALKDLLVQHRRREDSAHEKALREQKNVSRILQDISAAEDTAKKAGQRANKVKNELDTIRERKKRHQLRIASMRKKIEDLQEVLDEPVANVQEAITERKAQLTKRTASLRKLQDEMRQIDDERRNMSAQSQELHLKIDRRNARKGDLVNVDRQRRQEAFKFDPSIQYAVEWLEKNPGELEGEVSLPPIISVNVPRKDFAWQVEACTSVAQRKTFICQSRRDYETLMKLNKRQVVVDGRQVRVALNLATIEVTEETVNPPRPCTDEQLHQLGFDGFAIDFVDAPQAVIAFLCQTAGLHRAAITRKNSSEINSDLVQQTSISQWHTANDSNKAIRSMYGKKESVVMVTAPTPARAFALSVDNQAVKAIDEEIADCKRTLKQLEQPLSKLKGEYERLSASLKDAQIDYEEASAALKKLQNEANKHQRAHLELENYKRELARLEKEPDPEASRAVLQEEMMGHIKARIQTINTISRKCSESLETISTCARFALEQAQHRTNTDSVVDAQAAFLDQCTVYEEERNILLANLNKWNQVHSKAMEVLGTQIRLHPDLRESVKQRGSTATSEGCRTAIATIQAQLEASVGVSAEAVQRFKRLQAQLEEKQAAVEALQRRHGKLHTDIDNILKLFNPALDTLVEEASDKFSEAFGRVNCSGQLKVSREGAYDNWGIQILVSFRDSERMEVLKMQRHSGGERSLATVTYLMSLSEMSRTPFSLVDEINQGMDARAERSVHDSLVGVTCQNDVGQYFLITPKLLTGLEYHPKMKILVINNGPWLPDATDSKQRYGSLGTCLAKYRRKHKITA